MKFFLASFVFFAAIAIAGMSGCKTQEAQPGAPSPTPAPSKPSSPPPELSEITAIAQGSSCSKISWKNRGTAPIGYYKGLALTFARTLCNQDTPLVQIMSNAKTSDTVRDALAHMNAEFAAQGMKNDRVGVDTHRHVFVLLTGLGMMESSGKYCCGRDSSADFSTADSAEAGTFQSSYGSRRVSSELNNLFEQYKKDKRGCFLDAYKEGVKQSYCEGWNAQNWGTGDGRIWQEMIKSCPGAGTEWAGILVRKTGGSNGEYGPLRKKAVEIRKECDDMFLKVQKFVEANPAVCQVL